MKKFILITFIVLFCLVIAAQLIFSVVLKKIAVRELKKVIATDVTIDRVGANLSQGMFSFSGLSIQNPSGFKTENFLTIESGYIKLRLHPLLFNHIAVSEIYLYRPEINIEINNASTANMSLILKNGPSQAKTPGIGQVAQNKNILIEIGKIVVKNGRFKFVNYNLDPKGATAELDKIDITIANLVPAKNPNDMPTSLKCTASLPAEDKAGNIEFASNGSFISDQINFDLDFRATEISLPYFMPFYAANSPILAKKGYFDLRSVAKCRNNQLYALQKVDVTGLELYSTDVNLDNNTAFGLPTLNVIDFFNSSKGMLNFSFEITGTLSNPQFHLIEALKQMVAKTIKDAILNKVSELPNTILDKVEKGGKIEDAGKEAIKDIFHKILAPKE